MSQTTTREERRSALDEFATQVGQVPATVPAATYAPPVDVQRGALALPVLRDEGKVFNKLRFLAAAAGEEWYYRWPVKNRRLGTVDWVEGPSIKLANDLARIYGNNDVDIRVQDFGDTWLFHARFIDLESGSAMTRPFQQRKRGGAQMGDDADRNRDIAFQIGASKAIRNVVVNALRTYADFAVNEAKGALLDKIQGDFQKWHRNTIERVQNHVSLDRVEAIVGRKAKDWLVPDIARVIAMMTAVVDGMATLDETFPPLKRAENERQSDLDQFAQTASDSLSKSPDAEAGVASPPPNPPEAAPATLDPQQREDVIHQVMMAATRARDLDERLAELDGIQLIITDSLAGVASADFVKQLMAAGVKVARNELAQEAARRYLRGLPA